MAKKQPTRDSLTMECDVCGERYYRTSKNTRNTTGKLELKKHCPVCRKHTSHKERKK
ncbi:MAG: 50S ribosomal protein L33 [Planctomycetes bacterium]|nr:50S ribosomal protein L33 [Planctomycetota bacterium]